MKRILAFSILCFCLVLTGCSFKKAQTQSDDKVGQNYVISDSQKNGWKNYLNSKLNIAFDFPSNFELYDRGGSELWSEALNKKIDSYKIDLIKDDRTFFIILNNIPNTGCGETAITINKEVLHTGDIIILKQITELDDSKTRCIVYSGFSNEFEFVGSMPQTDVNYEKIFDDIVTSFQITSKSN